MVQNAEKKANNVVYPCINPTSYTRNLHPILHPKSLVNTGYLLPWCRKCRTFSKTFFIEGREEVVRKLKTAGFFGNKRQRSGSDKTLEFFGQKYGCFTSKVRMFSSQKSDVSVFRKVFSFQGCSINQFIIQLGNVLMLSHFSISHLYLSLL